jgi:hypothetical protein
MIPAVQDDMEGCPDSDTNISLMILIAMLGMSVFLMYDLVKAAVQRSISRLKSSKLMDDDVQDLQMELYGDEYMARCGKRMSSASERSMTKRTLRTASSCEDTSSSDEELQA